MFVSLKKSSEFVQDLAEDCLTALKANSKSSAKEGMRKAFETKDYAILQIATAFGVHYSTVSRAVNKKSKKKWLTTRPIVS